MKNTLHSEQSLTGERVLTNKIVVITGAGSGLGQALAIAFVNEGCQVIGLGRSHKTLQQTQQKTGDSHFSFYEVDVTDTKQLNQATADIVKHKQRIDYWFNNAAVYPKVNFLDESANDFAQAVNININGVANSCKAVLPIMIKQKFGRIFNVGTWADIAPLPESAAYSSSKGALHGLTKAIAADIAHLDLDIQIHEWIPGHLNTQMSGYTGIEPAVSAGWAIDIAKRQIDKKNSVFEQNNEWQPPKSFKQKLKAKLCFW